MVGIATDFGWSVQGDDGETYGEDGSPIPEPPPPKHGFFSRMETVAGAFRAKRGIRKSMKDVSCPFKVGDRVRTIHRSGGIVIEVDPKGNHGMGSIKVRFPDGAVIESMFIAHDLEKEQQ